MIPQKTIEEIRDKTDIVQVIGAFLDLKRAGRNYKALCPFHAEKTPSFMVNPERQIFHCFGCGKGGNAFHFLMEYEGIGFVEAVQKLAAQAGIEVDRYVAGGESKERLEPYYRAMEFAARYYQGVLLDAPGAQGARGYLERREIDRTIIDEFSLGFAPAGWDSFYRAAIEANQPRDILLELGLVTRSRGGSGYRDYFRNRVIFPIESISNRFVGLAGRVLDDSEPKYLNTSESPIYFKSKILYGLNRGKEHIRKSSSAIIVEGYMDYLMLWRKGIRNISAVCGTSFTPDQARLLSRYANRIYIINDGDRAGIRASVRAADVLLIEGLESQVVILPEGEDPDSFVRKRGAEELRELMHSAPSYFVYLQREALSGQRTTYRKNQVLRHILETVSAVDDAVRRDLLLQEAAGLFDVQAEVLRAGLRERRAPRVAESARPAGESRRREFQKLVFRVGLEHERFARKIIEELAPEDLDGELFAAYYRALEAALGAGIDTAGAGFIGAIEDEDLSRLASEIALTPLPPGPPEEFLGDTIRWLKREALKGELDLMKRRLRELEESGDPEAPREQIEIAEAYRKISRELKKLGFKEGIRTDGNRSD